jgi:hypothetical protein
MTASGNGIYLPKRLFTNHIQNGGFKGYGGGYGGGGNNYKVIKTGNFTPRFNNNINGDGPMPIDWGVIFNLCIFTLFIGSLFYVCLYRYRNKEKFIKEKELKQKQLVYEVKQALEEQQRKQSQKKYEQMMENRRQNQIGLTKKIETANLQLENPYLSNFGVASNMGSMLGENTLFSDNNFNNTSNFANNFGNSDNNQNYQINFEKNQYKNLESAYYNSGSLIDWN